VAELDQHIQCYAYGYADRLGAPGVHVAVRRYRWFIDPNGARDEVVEDVASDFNLPIGDKIQSRSPGAVIDSVTTGICSMRC
jgi:hypothetical protein